jgi:hypothetical protein
MSCNYQYTALGPVVVGFQTNSNSIDRAASHDGGHVVRIGKMF